MDQVISSLSARHIPSPLIDQNGALITTSATFDAHRAYLKDLLAKREYGRIPPAPDSFCVEVVEKNLRFAAGKAVLTRLRFTAEIYGKTVTFPFASIIPSGSEKPSPAFVHINFRSDVPDMYMPSEEIVDRGYALFSFCYKDVTSDDGDFTTGVAEVLSPTPRGADAPGKIALWAWAAMRVMDYIETLDCIDKENVAVIGHSRLGKTALLTGAHDERFRYIISNDSGCSGAAISRGKCGESLKKITTTFPFWFCPAFVEAAKDKSYPETADFDQNFLLSLSVPRHLMVGSAEKDLWADPESEFLCLAAVNEVYSLYGMHGLIHTGEIPKAVTALHDGDAHYHIRKGLHYLSREDWNAYIDYIDRVRR